MKPLAPLEISLVLRASASSSGDLGPELAPLEAVYGLPYKADENSL